MINKPSFWDYLIFNDDGVKGIKKDAPEKEKKAFYKYMEEEKEFAKKGIKR